MAPTPNVDMESALQQAADSLVHGVETMGDHPSIEELIALFDDEVAEPRAAELRSHVALCHDCSEEFESLSVWAPDHVEDATLRPTAAATAEDWGRLQDELESRPVPAPTFPRLVLIAASIAVGVVALVLWLASNRTTEPSTGSASVASRPYLAELFASEDGLKRVGGSDAVLQIPEGTDLLILRLILKDLTPHEAYRVEISTLDGTRWFTADGLERQPRGDVLVLVPLEGLVAGEHRLDLKDSARPEGEPFATFGFELVEDGAPNPSR